MYSVCAEYVCSVICLVSNDSICLARSALLSTGKMCYYNYIKNCYDKHYVGFFCFLHERTHSFQNVIDYQISVQPSNFRWDALLIRRFVTDKSSSDEP